MDPSATTTLSLPPVGAAGVRGEQAPGAQELTQRMERPRDAQEAAQAFEALFVEQLLREMRQGVPEDGLFKKGFAEKTFEQMLDRTYAGIMASRGGVGLADVLLEAWGSDAGRESE